MDDVLLKQQKEGVREEVEDVFVVVGVFDMLLQVIDAGPNEAGECIRVVLEVVGGADSVSALIERGWEQVWYYLWKWEQFGENRTT